MYVLEHNLFVTGMFASGGTAVLFGALEQGPKGPVFIAMCFLMRITNSLSFAAAKTASSSILPKAFPNTVATVLAGLDTFSGLGCLLGFPLGGFWYQSFAYAVPFTFLGHISLPINTFISHNYAPDPGKQLKRIGAPGNSDSGGQVVWESKRARLFGISTGIE